MRSVTPYTVTSTEPIIQADHNTIVKSSEPYQQGYYRNSKPAKSVDQLEQPYRSGYQNVMPTSRSAGNIIENYNTSYPNHGVGAELNGHYQPQQRPITPTSMIHSEPNSRQQRPITPTSMIHSEPNGRQQRPITPTSMIHSEPNGRQQPSQYMMTQQVTQPPEKTMMAPPQPAARISRSVATITSTSGMLNTDL